MRFTWPDNRYLAFYRWFNFEISWSGYSDLEKTEWNTPPERKTRLWIAFTGTGGGGILTRWTWIDISLALRDIITDRDPGNPGNISDIHGESEIKGDIFNPGDKNFLVMWRHGASSLGLELRDDTLRKKILFIIGGENDKNNTRGNILTATQQQFNQLVNLALAIQNYRDNK